MMRFATSQSGSSQSMCITNQRCAIIGESLHETRCAFGTKLWTISDRIARQRRCASWAYRIHTKTQSSRHIEEEGDAYYLTPTLERIQQQKSEIPNADASRSFTSSTTHQATILLDGLATSHLGLDPRQNTRHAPMVYHEGYSFQDWPTTYTFPMDKFKQTAYSLLNDSDEFLLHDEEYDYDARPLVLSKQHFFKPLSHLQFPLSFLSPPICPAFLQTFLSGSLTREECRLIGFREQTSRPELIERTVLEVAGTVLTAQLAMKYGLACHLAGGTHHAESGRGKGFTILNDLAVVARLMTWNEGDEVNDAAANNDVGLLRQFYRGDDRKVERVLVVDCDVHQGDGTATFHTDQTSPSNNKDKTFPATNLCNKLYTLDLHAESNYPHPKEKCTYDVPLPDDCDDERYLSSLGDALDRALEEVNPQLVLYNAGVDVYHSDKLGRLSLSWEGMKQRDIHVVRRCLIDNIPVACVVGGGYSTDVRELGIRHSLISRVCSLMWREYGLWRRK